MRIDDGHAALTNIVATYGQLRLSDENEAETRLKVIDEIIFNVLGWTKQDVAVEERISEDGGTSFADYVLRTATTAVLVEAKRAGTAFDLPTNRNRLKLGGVLREGAVGEAIRQARDYCRKQSIPFAVVTNGASWLIFPAVRIDQVPFEESEAHVFKDLEDIQQRLVQFWELLSRERVLGGNLQDELLGRHTQDGSRCNTRQVLPDAGYRLGRNALYDHIEPAVAAALSDESLLDDVEALEACYVKTSERVKYDSRLQVHVHDPIPTLGHKTVRVRAKKNVRRVDERIESVVRQSPLRFIVVLGPVGAGKTTFLHHTRKVTAASAIDGKVVWMLVDFKQATPEDSPRDFILRQLLQHIEADRSFDLGDWAKSISGAYASETDALRRGALYLLAQSDPDTFNRKIAEQINHERNQVQPFVEKILVHAARQWPLFLVIDNVDQLDNVPLQEAIFIEAQALARRIRCHVIMSMRESTYLKHRDRPVFDAFQFESFYIDPPSVLPVISHRFAYAKRVLDGKAARLTTESGIIVNVPDLSIFFDLAAHSLLGADTGTMLECLAGGDIRRGLTLVREFLASGHTNADRAIAAYLVDGKYRFPKHEVLRGCVLGAFKYYDDRASLVPNVFDAKLGFSGVQLLRLQIVSVLVSRAHEGILDGLLVSEVIAALGRTGVPERDVLSVLADLQSRRLVHSLDGLPVCETSAIAGTRLAAYVIRDMCRDFTYAEFCSIDTDIHDPESLVKMRDWSLEIEATRNLADKITLRIDRVREFLSYLKTSERKLLAEAKRRSVPAEWHMSLIADEIIPGLERAFSVVQQSALRNYGPPLRGALATIPANKDFVFIRDDSGNEWFGHQNEFADETEWSARRRGARCEFFGVERQGKRKAVSIKLA